MKKDEIELIKEEYRTSVSKVLLSTVGMINPVFGIAATIISEGSEFKSKIETKRINSLVIELDNRINELETSMVPFEFFESDEFYDLSLKMYETAVRTSEPEKHKLISHIFINSIDDSCNWEDDIKHIFLELVKDFSSNHFIILKFLSENLNRTDIKSYMSLHSEFQIKLNNYQIDLYQFRHYCREIENKTLIIFSRDINEINSSGGVMLLESSDAVPAISLTTLGEKFISLYA